MKTDIADAKNKLPELIRAVEEGESVTICRCGTAVVDIVRSTKVNRGKPKFGTLRHKVMVHDPDWWKPISN